LPNVARQFEEDLTMRTSIAYLAGAGTIVVAIAAGLGGGLLMANIMNPHEGREVGKLERRAQQAQQSPQPNSQQSTPSNVTASSGPQAPSPYQAATQQATITPVVVAPAPSNSPQPAGDASHAAPPIQPSEQVQVKEQSKETATVNERQSGPPMKSADKSASKPQARPQEARPQEQVQEKQQDQKQQDQKQQDQKQQDQKQQDQKQQDEAAIQPTPRDQASSPDNAYAKARDADVKRQAAEQRKADRRQWATRRQQRDQEMRDVEQNVREDSDSRGHEVIVQRDDSDGPRFFGSDRPRNRDDDRPRNFGGPIGFPHINLFGPD
jgi:hypothetical protein